jgi:alkanesulfonate monooxygenase SsuD/methylene tetrahydromethanopterin reductase-like flavin-dependent oxidoreductase (luciferase family)
MLSGQSCRMIQRNFCAGTSKSPESGRNLNVKVGLSLWFQNIPDFLDRGKPGDYSIPIPLPDSSVYANELRLADLIEPLGYDSMWTVEHHFGPYGMTCNPLQILSNIAGRTERIELGTMVVVLPWHDPLRVAEGIAVLDNLMGGRRLMLGFGRGAAPQEFETFGVDYAESRERMAEGLEIVRLALTREWFSYEGKFFNVPHTTIRPRPLTEDLTKNIVLAWSSPETMEWAANTGGGQLYSNFLSWDALATTSPEFNRIRATRGWHPVAPIGVAPIFCTTNGDDVGIARDWFKQTVDSSMWHYGLFNQPSFRKRLEGKEGPEVDKVIAEIFEEATMVGVFGTPDECTEQLIEIQRKSGLAHLIANVHFGMMPIDVAERSIRLFAKEVLPVLQAIPTPDIFSTPYQEVSTSTTAQ